MDTCQAPSVCQAAGQQQRLECRSEKLRTLSFRVYWAGAPAGTPIVGKVGFLGLSTQTVAEISTQMGDFWGILHRVEGLARVRK